MPRRSSVFQRIQKPGGLSLGVLRENVVVQNNDVENAVRRFQPLDALFIPAEIQQEQQRLFAVLGERMLVCIPSRLSRIVDCGVALLVFQKPLRKRNFILLDEFFNRFFHEHSSTYPIAIVVEPYQHRVQEQKPSCDELRGLLHAGLELSHRLVVHQKRGFVGRGFFFQRPLDFLFQALVGNRLDFAGVFRIRFDQRSDFEIGLAADLPYAFIPGFVQQDVIGIRGKTLEYDDSLQNHLKTRLCFLRKHILPVIRLISI